MYFIFKILFNNTSIYIHTIKRTNSNQGEKDMHSLMPTINQLTCGVELKLVAQLPYIVKRFVSSSPTQNSSMCDSQIIIPSQNFHFRLRLRKVKVLLIHPIASTHIQFESFEILNKRYIVMLLFLRKIVLVNRILYRH